MISWNAPKMKVDMRNGKGQINPYFTKRWFIAFIKTHNSWLQLGVMKHSLESKIIYNRNKPACYSGITDGGSLDRISALSSYMVNPKLSNTEH